MGSKKAPEAPDYEAAAIAQGANSRENTLQQTWANRPTQNTPWGQTAWTADQTIDPGTGQPVTHWVQNQTLNPQLQKALDQQLGLQGKRSDLAGSFMSRVEKDMQNPFDWEGINAQSPRGEAIDSSQYRTDPTGAVTYVQQQDLDTSAPQQLTTGRERIDPTGQDTQGLERTTKTANEANFVSERQRIENALFERMQPEHDRQTAQLQTQLANQGITPGSEAYKQEMQRVGDQQSRERFNALQQGGQEQQGLQSMMMGQQQQAFGQGQSSQAARNQALQQLFAQQQGAGQFGLGAQQQAFGQDMSSQQAQNAAKQAMYQQALSSGQFSNQALQQMFGQNAAANNQNYTQAMNSSQYANVLRQQAIAEESQRRNMSLNEMNALLTGQQVQSPNMPGFNTAQRSDTAELLKASGMTGQSQMDAFNANQQSSQALMSGVMGGATAMM